MPDDAAKSDPVARRIAETQFRRAGDIANSARGSVEYRAAVEELARDLHATAARRERQPESVGAVNTVTDETDLVEVLDGLADERQRFTAASSRLERAMARCLEAMPDFSSAPAGDLAAFANLMETAGARLDEPVGDLDTAIVELNTSWGGLDRGVSAFVRLAGSASDEQRRELSKMLSGLITSIGFPDRGALEQQSQLLGRLSRHLRPISRALLRVLATVRTMQDGVDRWTGLLRASGGDHNS